MLISEILLIEEIEDKGHIQGELLAAMLDAGDFAQVQWKNMIDTEGYKMMSNQMADPSFKRQLNSIFRKYLNTDMENTVAISSAVNDKTSIFKIIKYLQKNTNQKKGINPKSFNLNIENYNIDQASVFNWHGAIFLVIKDTIGPPSQIGVVGPGRETHYHIYAAKDSNY